MAVVDLRAGRHATAGSHKGRGGKDKGRSPRETKGTSHPFRLLSDTISHQRPGTGRDWTGHEVTRDDTARPVSARLGENGSSGWPIRRIQGIDSGFVPEDQAQERSSTSEDAGDAADHSGGYRSVLEIVKVAHQVDGDERGEEEAEGREAEQPNPDAAPFRSGLTGDDHGGCRPA